MTYDIYGLKIVQTTQWHPTLSQNLDSTEHFFVLSKGPVPERKDQLIRSQ